MSEQQPAVAEAPTPSAADLREAHERSEAMTLLKRPFTGFSRDGNPLTAEENEKLKTDLGTIQDPSNPNRTVPAKTANKAMMTHQKWKNAQIKAGKMDPKTGKSLEKSGPIANAIGQMIKWGVVGVLLALATGQFIAGDPIWGYRGKWMKLRTYFPPQQRVFTPAELALYNGRDEDKPIYIAIMGHVYDVSKNRRTYGPGGSYHFFSGKDASRAYVTGCFKKHLTHDLREFDDEQIEQVAGWKKFFDDHEYYDHVGTVNLPEIDPASPVPDWKC